MDAQTGVRPTAPDRPPLYRRLRAADVVVGTFAVLAMILATTWLPLPAKIDRLTVVNPTGYTLDVDVTGGGRDGWTPVTAIGPHSTRAVERVLDQGDVWVVRFAGQGAQGGELHLTKDQLQDAGWRLHVPPEVGQRLMDAGATPDP